MKFLSGLAAVAGVSALVAAGVHGAVAASHAAPPFGASKAPVTVKAASGVQPFVKAGHGPRPFMRRDEQGPGCTVVNPSQVLSQSLYGSPPYSAAVAVTTNGATVNATNVNAAGCDFGIYVAPGVSGVTVTGNVVHDAFQVGIMVDSASNVNVRGNQVSQTGWHDQNGYDPNGVQTGLAIYYLAASGDIADNFVTQYQKNGITANLAAIVSLENNVAIGLGSESNPTQFIAQNGYQIYEATLSNATGNFSAYNFYANPSYAATGYLLCDATTPAGKIINKSEFYGKAPNANTSQQNNINIYAAKSC